MWHEVYSIQNVSVETVSQFFSSVRAMYDDPTQIPGLLDFGSRPCSEAFAAEFRGNIVGVTTISLNGVDNPTPGVLDTVYVHPKHRRRQLGVRLCEMAIRRLLDLDRTPISCHIISDGGEKVIDQIEHHLKSHLRIRRSVTYFADPGTPVS